MRHNNGIFWTYKDTNNLFITITMGKNNNCHIKSSKKGFANPMEDLEN